MREKELTGVSNRSEGNEDVEFRSEGSRVNQGGSEIGEDLLRAARVADPADRLLGGGSEDVVDDGGSYTNVRSEYSGEGRGGS